MARGFLALAALVATALAGCLAAPEPLAPPAEGPPSGWLPPDVAWDATGNLSKVLAGVGPFDALPVERLDLDGAEGARIATAVWRPSVPEGTQVPVILHISPYFGANLERASNGTKEFYFQNFVSHGYAFARVAVRGSSFSGGCMEFFGAKEQADVDAAVTFYGAQEWSNGNLAIIGGSYDGTTPWVAASYGNPYLKTIVPISGLTDVAGLMYRNGTSENRGWFMSMLYWSGSGDPTREEAPSIPENFCPEVPVGALVHGYTGATGDREAPPLESDYWAIRDWRERVRQNYQGSVYLVHGMQDWNVESTMAFPYVTELQKAGYPVKMMLGQWGHAIPDGASREDASVRWDWAELLKRWFDRELKGMDVEVGPAVDIQDSDALWRTEDAWPPADATLTDYHLGEGALGLEPTASGSAAAANPLGVLSGDGPAPVPPGTVPMTEWRFTTGPLEQDLRFAGMAQLHITLTPTTPRGGNLYAELLDVGDGEAQRVAHGVMNLQYYAGGTGQQMLTPGQAVVALMELFPADARVEAGHELVLRIVPETPMGDGVVPGLSAPMELAWGDGASVLRLPVVQRDVGDGKYLGQPDVPV